jgi:hypothetical protein
VARTPSPKLCLGTSWRVALKRAASRLLIPEGDRESILANKWRSW